jgi:TRAP-type mannitol/chloroaromatic compound transport system substrate-binding protein
MKFYEAAKYYYYPGMHEPGAMLAMGINKSWWDSLDKVDQAIITAACAEENANTMAETNANNGVNLNRLINEHGVELREFNDEIYDAFGEAAAEVLEEAMDHSPMAKKIFESFINARQEIGSWMAISDVAYSNKRNRVLGIPS